MNLRLVKPDLYFFDAYNDMMREWCESGTRIAPWFLDEPIASIDEFAKFAYPITGTRNFIPHKALSPQWMPEVR